MDDEELRAWKTCWRANLWLYQSISEPLRCVACDKTYNHHHPRFHSNFWVEATRRSVGHLLMTVTETSEDLCLGVCQTCDQNYVLDVVTGKRCCRRDGCRRVVRINEIEVELKVGNTDGVLEWVNHFAMWQASADGTAVTSSRLSRNTKPISAGSMAMRWASKEMLAGL
jgi:hypothetical protein